MLKYSLYYFRAIKDHLNRVCSEIAVILCLLVWELYQLCRRADMTEAIERG